MVHVQLTVNSYAETLIQIGCEGEPIIVVTWIDLEYFAFRFMQRC
jgi:hypothetical protein